MKMNKFRIAKCASLLALNSKFSCFKANIEVYFPFTFRYEMADRCSILILPSCRKQMNIMEILQFNYIH